VSEASLSGRSRRVVSSRRRYVVITEAGVRFAKSLWKVTKGCEFQEAVCGDYRSWC